MISKQTVYLDAGRQNAVPEGHKDARFLLVREGHEVDDNLVEKYDAASLVGSASKAKPDKEPLPGPPTLKGDADSAPAPDSKPAKKRAPKKSAKK